MNFKEKMFTEAKQAITNAYAPYSNFKVGACLRAEDNSLFSGCNIENASYGLCLCAEAVALAKLISAGKKRIIEAVIISDGDLAPTPCGACRQRLNEFAADNLLIHMGTLTRLDNSQYLEKLLPQAFGPVQMGITV